MPNYKTLCAVPFVEAFSNPAGGWRNCCTAAPQVTSAPEQSFNDWWAGDSMQDFRSEFGGDSLPLSCTNCALQEQASGNSFRTAVNNTVDLTNLRSIWPSRWNVIFGNTCNLACWICNEHSSSTIEQHKKKLSLLPLNYQSSNDRFENTWATLRENILKSYQHHDTVTLTILGGEPLYNLTVIEFLSFLVDNNLSRRTRLEFHTNATKFNQKIQTVLEQDNWNHVCIFLSLDAVGKKAEWLRYGCNWDQIKNNIPQLKKCANYVEVHCTLSMLNLIDLDNLQKFCEQQHLLLKVNPLSDPAYMDIRHWDLDKDIILQYVDIAHQNFSVFYQLLGSDPVPGAAAGLRDYINKFKSTRRSLKEFDPRLYEILGLGV
jgi:organic radical activating enzyme